MNDNELIQLILKEIRELKDLIIRNFVKLNHYEERLHTLIENKAEVTTSDIVYDFNISRQYALFLMKKQAKENENYRFIKGRGQTESKIINTSNLPLATKSAYEILSTMTPGTKIRIGDILSKYPGVQWSDVYNKLRSISGRREFKPILANNSKGIEDNLLFRAR